ncbi:MAG: SusC/RagA family TonB-linked outer membrane protein, partial [Mucilaginibacter polytrichastri]|nr:SusC/RagA family TonB-linked outer membrane protein [Mucilaginibacter polytrichastri]
MKKLLLRIFVLVLPCLYWSASFAQEKTITGKVTDKQDNSPLIGVSVTAKGASNGVSTDPNGNFKISVPQNTNTLVFTYVGYTRQEADIQNKTSIQIALSGESKSLNEVVVVGYGTQKRKDVTGSVTSIRSGDFNKGVYNDPNQLIQGKTPGVVITKPGGDPNGGATVRLRGINSLTGSNTPLYVIDGIVGADLATIPANEIESFDILKDAATASIYGARAANGVIIVTTKRGRSGQSQIEYNGSVSVDKAANYLELMSAEDIRNYQISVGNTNYTGFGGNTDWFRSILRTAYSQNHTLSLSGGSDKTTYRASVNYLNKNGILVNNALERLTGRLNVNQKGLNDRLNIGLDLTANQDFNNYIGSGNSAVGTIFNYTVNNDPSQPIRKPDGSYNNFFGLDYGNTVSLLNDLVSRNRWNVLRGSLSGNLKIMEGLTASVVTTYESKNNNSGYFSPSYSVFGQ